MCCIDRLNSQLIADVENDLKLMPATYVVGLFCNLCTRLVPCANGFPIKLGMTAVIGNDGGFW